MYNRLWNRWSTTQHYSQLKCTCQVLGAPVETVAGSVPSWLSGTLVRHACGVLGETQHSTAPEFLNRVGHLFDCIEMGQAYHFHQGEVTFSSQFYDTTMVEVWLKYDQNMNQSSVFWGTIYGERNRTAMDREVLMGEGNKQPPLC